METVGFTRMDEGTAEDYALLARAEALSNARLADRILAAVSNLRNSFTGYQVDRCEHSLQSATRARVDGREDEYVVAALIHDIGDELSPENHGELTAAIMRPYFSERLCWIVQHHPVFQMYHYGKASGDDPDARERYRGHPWFDDCAEFCALYDQNCFDPDFESDPLESFEPLVRDVFAAPRFLAALQS